MQDTSNQQSQDIHAMTYRRFFLQCQKTGTLALPILSMVENQIFNCVGQFISEGMAEAMGEVLRHRKVIEVDASLPSAVTSPGKLSLLSQVKQKIHVVEEEKVTYIPIREINLDDNGLKDQAFANILGALATQPALKRMNYVSNEIGAKSIV